MIKTCKLCGKQFETNYETKSICNGEHFNTCTVCGKQFPVNTSNYTKKTCSKECMKVHISNTLKSDEVRQKTEKTNFHRYGAKAPSCNSEVKERVKQTNRERFGVDYAIQLDEIKELRKQNNLDKYGVGSPSMLQEVKDKQFETYNKHYGRNNPEGAKELKQRKAKTCLLHYGVDNPMKSNEIKNKVRQTTLERYGVECYSKSGKFLENFQKHCMNKFGVPYPTMSEEIIVKMNRTKLQRYGTIHPMKNRIVKDKQRDTVNKLYGGYTYQSPELMNKVKKTCKERYGTEFPSQSEEVRKRVMRTNMERYGVPYTSQLAETHRKAAQTRASVTASDGTHVDSSYEKIFYDFLIRNNIEFSYQSEALEYEYNGEFHKTIIDFKVGDILFEVKGSHLLKGCFDYNHVPVEEKLKLYKKNQVVVITDSEGSDIFGKPNSTVSNGFKYLHKCPEPLIGVDISLFTDCPEFPYRDDRPKCFYDVRVNGQNSAHEAFYNEQIRWKMIMNRIQYSGGFIDNKQILTALNVTRTCKQPSWFAKTLAKNIIKNYCTTNTVYDLAAGWGARADAAKELHKRYVACDLNSELVDWHHSMGRKEIVCDDGKNFKYEGECSIFICPPYSNPKTGRCFEDYNFKGFDSASKSLSQCDWLKIAIQNAPKAREAILVCKIVDEGFESYIVDTIENKSHFGRNNEYIIVIKHEDFNKVLNM